MSDLLRQEIATSADTVIVKVGTRVLTGADGLLDTAWINTLAEELVSIINTGRKIVLVSSGAVGAGMGKLGLRQRPTDLAHLQAVAAVGQASLVEAYDQALSQHGSHAAQILLTADETGDDTLTVSTVYYYCQISGTGLCKVAGVSWTVPLKVSDTADEATVSLRHQVGP